MAEEEVQGVVGRSRRGVRNRGSLRPACRNGHVYAVVGAYVGNHGQRRCKACAKAASRTRHPLRHVSMYGLTIEQYKAMLEAQGGVCAICRRPETRRHWRTGEVKRLSIDHDHRTERIRGLVCGTCNFALSYIGDDPEIAIRMAEYLRG